MTLKQKNLLFLVPILAMVLLYIFSGGSVGISLDFGEESLALSAADYDWSILYDQVESLEVIEFLDTGTVIEGTQRRTLRCGIFENNLWGQYTLCIDPRIDSYIVVTTKSDGIYVLNYENRDTTGQLYQMFTDLLHSKGYQ